MAVSIFQANLIHQNLDQNEILVQYMESHLQFARGQFLGLNGAESRTNQWIRLTNILNAFGAGRPKSCQGWMRRWAELKRDAKVYNARNDKLYRQTGNNGDELPEYNEFFERILNITGREHGNGLALIPEICSVSEGPLCKDEPNETQQDEPVFDNNEYNNELDPSNALQDMGENEAFIIQLKKVTQKLATTLVNMHNEDAYFKAQVLTLLTEIEDKLRKLVNCVF